jgi:hypothetical protein
MSLIICDLTASASYTLKVGRPRTHAKLMTHQAAVKTAVETLRIKIALEIYITGKCKFLVDSRILK